MKYTPSIAFDEMSGSAKGVTAAKSRGRKYLRNRGHGGNSNTVFQASVKSIFKQLSQGWKNLTEAQMLAWNNLADSQAGRSVLGSNAKISGLNLYQRLNFWVVKCGGTAMSNPPTLVGVDAPAAATIVLSDSAFTLTLASIPASVTNLKLVVMASKPQSAGIAQAFDKASAFSAPMSVVSTAISLKSDYEAKYGAVTETAPKIFLKYFYVNTVTGEKSSEMLAEARLANSGDEEDGE